MYIGVTVPHTGSITLTDRRMNGIFREAAQSIGAVRDAQANIECLDRYEHSLSASDFQEIRQFLSARVPQPYTAETLRKILSDVAPIRWNPTCSWADMMAQLDSLYRKGKKLLALCEAEPTGHNFHELRKVSKKLWYIFCLFSCRGVAFYDALMNAWKHLADHLGNHHDIVILEEVAEQHMEQSMKDKLQPVLEAEKLALEQKIFELAPLLYWQQAESFVNLFKHIRKIKVIVEHE